MVDNPFGENPMADSKPTHRAYSVLPRKDSEGKEDKFWLNIGSVFAHSDGKGPGSVTSWVSEGSGLRS